MAALAAPQVRLVLEILERHPKLPLLVVSDSDTVWLRQPWTYFNQRPAADFFVSSDCLSHRASDCSSISPSPVLLCNRFHAGSERFGWLRLTLPALQMEDEWQPGHDKVLCGHVPGNAG